MGEKVVKENFLIIYGVAHTQALMPENVSAAFRKTIWPYVPSIVTYKMMARSLKTLSKAALFIAYTSPAVNEANLGGTETCGGC